MTLQKKLVSLIAAGLLVFGAAACEGDTADTGTDTGTTDTTTTEPPAAEEPMMTEDPAATATPEG